MTRWIYPWGEGVTAQMCIKQLQDVVSALGEKVGDLYMEAETAGRAGGTYDDNAELHNARNAFAAYCDEQAKNESELATLRAHCKQYERCQHDINVYRQRCERLARVVRPYKALRDTGTHWFEPEDAAALAALRELLPGDLDISQ